MNDGEWILAGKHCRVLVQFPESAKTTGESELIVRAQSESKAIHYK